MKKLRLIVEKREEKRTGACGRLRKRGFIPAVIYGHSGTKNLQVHVADFRKMMLAKGNNASLIELVCGNETLLAMLQATQRNPREDHYLHIDFKQISADQALRTTLPIRIVGEAEGVKNFGGILDFLTHSITIECLPEDLPEFIELDVKNLQVGQSIHVKDLPLSKGVTYKTNADVVIVSCVKATEEDSAEEKQAIPVDGKESAADEEKASKEA